MREFYRIFINKKTLILISLIAVLNFCLFLYNCGNNIKITKTGNDLQTYISADYDAFLKSTVMQGDILKKLQIYNNSNEFTSNNILKTVNDYSKLSSIYIKYGENRGIVAFKNFHLSDFLLIAFLLFITLQFNNERKKGIVNLVRSTKKGRLSLCGIRIMVLLFSSGIMSILLYGGNIIAATISYGSMGLSRPIQSVPEFMRCSMNISIGDYFEYSVIIKILAAVTIALIFYVLISVFDVFLSAVISAIISVLSFALYRLIIPISDWNWFRFINIYTIFKTDDYFTDYYNLYFFGKPIGMLNVSVVGCLILLSLCIFSCLIIHQVIYASRSKTSLSKLSDKIISVISRRRPQLPMFLWEGYKLLFKQKGILFVGIIIYFAISSSLEYGYFYSDNKYEKEWYSTYNGEINQQMIDNMEQKYTQLSIEKKALQSKIDSIQNKIATSGTPENQIDSYKIKYEESLLNLNTLSNKASALKKIEGFAEQGLQYNIKNNASIFLVKPNTYQLMLRDDKKTNQKNCMYILLGIIGAFSGIMAYERQNNISSCLKTVYRGRKKLLVIKILWVFLISTVIALIIHSTQLILINKLLGFNDLSAPVQSLDFLRSFPLNMSIKSFLILLFAARIFVAFIVGVIVMIISYFSSDTITTIGISTFLLGLPSFMLSLGIIKLSFISITNFLGVIELIC